MSNDILVATVGVAKTHIDEGSTSKEAVNLTLASMELKDCAKFVLAARPELMTKVYGINPVKYPDDRLWLETEFRDELLKRL